MGSNATRFLSVYRLKKLGGEGECGFHFNVLKAKRKRERITRLIFMDDIPFLCRFVVLRGFPLESFYNANVTRFDVSANLGVIALTSGRSGVYSQSRLAHSRENDVFENDFKFILQDTEGVIADSSL